MHSRPLTVLEPGQSPPPDYYADNLKHLTEVVQGRFAAVLDQKTRQFIEHLPSLLADSQRLLARLLCRKGPLFRQDRLRYAEVSCTADALEALNALGWIAMEGREPADELFKLALRTELRNWFGAVGATSKAAHCQYLLARYSDAQLRDRLRGRLPWFRVTVAANFEVCQWLYFGDRYQSASVFITEDLGMLRYADPALSEPDWLTADTSCLAVHRRLYRLSALSHRLPELEAVPGERLAASLAQALCALSLSREQHQVRSRALLRVGAYLERHGASHAALEAFAATDQHPARERRVRLFWKQGDRTAARALQSCMASGPNCAAEADFAARFQRPRRAPLPQRRLTLLTTPRERIERHAIRLLAEPGCNALHLENQLPRGLAGLIYWPALFSPVPGAFTRPYQLGPNDLYWPDFASVRKAELTRIETAFDPAQPLARQRWQALLEARLETAAGIANSLVHWGQWHPAFVTQLLDHIPLEALFKLARFTIRNLDGYRTGFPDLLVLGTRGRGFELLEVKGPGDTLQGHQRRWLTVLNDLGWPAQVLRLERPPAEWQRCTATPQPIALSEHRAAQ